MIQLCSMLYGLSLVASNAIVTESAKGAPPIIPDGVKTRHVVQEGINWKLTCAAEGERPLLITWTKDGESITSAWPRYKQSNEAKNLQIKNVAMEDAGTYRCRAANGFGYVDVEYTVTVVAKDSPQTSITDDNEDDDFAPPDLSDPSLSSSDTKPRSPFWIGGDPTSPSLASDLIRPIGDNVKLRCRAAGHPKPDIVWLKDGREMDDSAVGWSRGKWTLYLKDLRPEDSGSYMCRIFNIWGTLNATFMVKVKGDESPLPQFEKFHPLNTTVNEGQSATFHCRVKSMEKPVLQWIKVIEDPSHLDFNQSIEVHGLHITVLDDKKYASSTVDFKNSTYSKLLYIPESTSSDAGWYVCVMTSQKGHLSHKFAYLQVISSTQKRAPMEPLPLHIVVGIPVAFVVSLVVGYAVYFLRKHQQKPSIVRTNATTNGQRPPPPPSYPPPSLPPSSSSHKTSPPRNAQTAMSCPTSGQQYASSSDHSSAQQNTVLQQQPLLCQKENGYVPGHVPAPAPATAGAYRQEYKPYHRLDPQMMSPLNGQLCNGDLAYETTTTATTPQPYELRYDDSDFSDSYFDQGGASQMQHYPSLYSCR